jgi:hypothetical protein
MLNDFSDSIFDLKTVVIPPAQKTRDDVEIWFIGDFSEVSQGCDRLGKIDAVQPFRKGRERCSGVVHFVYDPAG